MGKSGEFFTFDEVLNRLGVDEGKLKRLVSEGEIRAFREGEQMKFRRADVENLDLVGSQTEEETGVIDLSAGGADSSETLTDDLIFDEGDDLDLTSADAGLQTAEISSQDTFVDEGIGMSTEPLGVSAGEMTEVMELDDEDEEDDMPVRGGRREAPPRRVVAAPEEPRDAGWAALMAVTAVIMILGVIVVLGIRDADAGTIPQLALDIAGPFIGE